MESRKRFLVIVRAGDKSLHPAWTNSLPTRDWDLVVSYFGDNPELHRGAGVRRIDDKGLKWPGLRSLLTRHDFWQDYDYIWLPDDDLAATQADISNLFRLVESHGLALAQPALSWPSFYSHPVTLRHPSFRLRLTDFVEIMAPCFARAALETCLPTLRGNVSGWGFDWVWPRLLSDDGPRAAIIDDVSVTHTRRPGGPGYAGLQALRVLPGAEARALLQKYGIAANGKPRVLAAIDQAGRRLDRADPIDAAILAERLRGDWDEFLTSRHRLELPSIALPNPQKFWGARW